MSALREALEEYLALRRGLGSELRRPGACLRRFVDFLDREAAPSVTTDLAFRWAREPAQASPATWARRLGDVRRFATWLSAIDPRTQVHPRGSCPTATGGGRRTYIATEVERVVLEASRLPSASGLRALT